MQQTDCFAKQIMTKRKKEPQKALETRHCQHIVGGE